MAGGGGAGRGAATRRGNNNGSGDTRSRGRANYFGLRGGGGGGGDFASRSVWRLRFNSFEAGSRHYFKIIDPFAPNELAGKMSLASVSHGHPRSPSPLAASADSLFGAADRAYSAGSLKNVRPRRAPSVAPTPTKGA